MVIGFITMFFDEGAGHKVFQAGIGSSLVALKLDKK